MTAITGNVAGQQADADRARADAHAARFAAKSAVDANRGARFARADARLLREGVCELGKLLASPADMSMHTPENALHDDDGTVITALVVECLSALDRGYPFWDVMESFNQRRQDAQVVHPADESARHLYDWADTLQAQAERAKATMQPGLPRGAKASAAQVPAQPGLPVRQPALASAAASVVANASSLAAAEVNDPDHELYGVVPAPPGPATDVTLRDLLAAGIAVPPGAAELVRKDVPHPAGMKAGQAGAAVRRAAGLADTQTMPTVSDATQVLAAVPSESAPTTKVSKVSIADQGPRDPKVLAASSAAGTANGAGRAGND
jgi:hypothetical protein